MKLFDFTQEQERGWEMWLYTQPEVVQHLATRFPPNNLYENTQVLGQRWTVVAYGEDGTMRMLVSSEHNVSLVMDREIFGVLPEDIKDVPDEEPK